MELLIGIAVTATLCALLLPSLKKSIEGGRQTKCMHNLRQLYVAIYLYAGENGGAVPLYKDQEAPDTEAASYWHRRVGPYLATQFGTANVSKIFLCPSDPEPYLKIISYGMNSALTGYRLSQFETNAILIGEAKGSYGVSKPDSLRFSHDEKTNLLLRNGSVQAMKTVPDVKTEPALWKPTL